MTLTKLLAGITSVLILLLVTVSCSFGDGDTEDGNLYRILVGDKYGFMNKHGRVVIEPQYDEAHRYFCDGICYVRLGQKKYLIDRKGNIKAQISDSVQNVYKFVNGFARIISDKGEGFLSCSGQVVVAPVNHKTSINKDGERVYFLIQDSADGENGGKNWFIADSLGNRIGQQYDSILVGFQHGLATVKLNGKWGYMDPEGNLAIEPVYDCATPFSDEGLARVRKGNSEYFITRDGTTVVGDDIDIDRILTDFKNNRAAVIVNGEKFLIDKTGEKICSLECDTISSYDNYSLATVIRKGKAAKIDISGNVVVETKFDDIYDFHDGIAFARDNNHFGAIDFHGNVIVDFIHDQYHPMDDEYILSFSDNVYGRNRFSYYDHKGNLLWQDIPQMMVRCPRNHPQREDFVQYFDANIASLDPIEGIYYVTNKRYHQSTSHTDEVELSYTNSDFMAIARTEPDSNEFIVFLLDGTCRVWANKFVKEGNSNTYSVINNSKNKEHRYSNDGKVTIVDYNLFDFRLNQAPKEPSENLFVTYEFVRDYPSVSEYTQYNRSKWSGTGFAVADGIIATTYHATNGAKSIIVKGINGKAKKGYKGYVIAQDKALDLSMIKIVDKEFKGFDSIPYTIQEKNVKAGDEVFVWGYPTSSSWSKDLKLSGGTITSSTGYIGNETMYLMSIPSDQVYGGSPVFNAEGNLIGIVCEKHPDAVQTESFAIKASNLLDLINKSNYKIKLPEQKGLKEVGNLSDKEKEVKDFVYLLECESTE